MIIHHSSWIEKPVLLCYDISEVINMMHLLLNDQYDKIPWDKLDAVVFDVGNVLLQFSPDEVLPRCVPERPDLYPELTIRIFKSPYWCMRDRNSATVDEVIAAMSKTAPALEPYIRRVMLGWIDLPPMAEGVAALRACKAHGVKLYALTNYADLEFAHVCSKYDFFSLFDGYVVSAREHLVKPGHEIYELLTARYHLDPARTVFIDDSIANAEGALECGWQAICYNRPGLLTDFICG